MIEICIVASVVIREAIDEDQPSLPKENVNHQTRNFLKSFGHRIKIEYFTTPNNTPAPRASSFPFLLLSSIGHQNAH
jgi:hypothetical protein